MELYQGWCFFLVFIFKFLQYDFYSKPRKSNFKLRSRNNTAVTVFVYQLFLAALGLCWLGVSFLQLLLSVTGPGLLVAVASLVGEHGLQAHRPQSQCTGLVAPRHVESSWTRGETHVPCIGRPIPIHRATGEVLGIFFLGSPECDS